MGFYFKENIKTNTSKCLCIDQYKCFGDSYLGSEKKKTRGQPGERVIQTVNSKLEMFLGTFPVAAEAAAYGPGGKVGRLLP